MRRKNQREKTLIKKNGRSGACFTLALLLTLIPLIWLGYYNYPTGDDYYYGVEAHLVWQQTGNFFRAFLAACQGVVKSYQNWQGTYSALLLMYLAPNAFSNTAYHLVPLVILLLLCGGIFFLLRPLVRYFFAGSVEDWIILSSVLSMLCIQTVDFQSDSFYWYNGSMYYTGFFAVTLFFLGILFCYLHSKRKLLLVPLILLGIFLGGGNYVSLFPCLLLLVTMTFMLAWRGNRQALSLGIVTVVLGLSFGISAVAPGNSVRQSGMWKIPAWKAIAKSLLQGLQYTFAWIGFWWILAAVILIPVVWRMLHQKETKGGCKFSHPILFTGYFYGLFCAMSCPLFYTMNSTGPGRAVAIIYYTFLLGSFAVLFYWVGFVAGKVRERQGQPDRKAAGNRWLPVRICLILLSLLGICLTGSWQKLSTVKAVRMLTDGEAAGYAEEYEQRMELLTDPEIRQVVLTPFENQPELIYSGDLPGDLQDATNKRVARYFGKESIYVNYP